MSERLDPARGWSPPADHPDHDAVVAAATALRARFGAAPRRAIILGSGLGGVVSRLDDPQLASHHELGLPAPSVSGHKGVVGVGGLGGQRVVVLAGRVHVYEGGAPEVVARTVRALHLWGVEELILTASVGGVRPDLGAGSLVVLDDLINLMGRSVLFGRPWGHRFPDMSHCFDPSLRAALREAAASAGVVVHEGTYVAFHGPTYETPAEIRMVAMLGAAVVGMSVAPEVHAAKEVGLTVGGVGVVANAAAGVTDAPLDHADVLAAGAAAVEDLLRLLAATR